MESITNYKDMALASLEGRWTKAAVASLIYIGLAVGLSECFGFVKPVEAEALLSCGTSLLLLPLAWGYAVWILRFIRREDTSYGSLFNGYQQFARTFVTELLKGLYIGLWSLLLIVPGIVKSYSYAMTEFIMHDDETLSYDAAISRSMELMQGHKMQLFLLDLSMIGWALLCLLTAGIGFIFLEPYVSCCHAHFYEDLKAEDWAKQLTPRHEER